MVFIGEGGRSLDRPSFLSDQCDFDFSHISGFDVGIVAMTIDDPQVAWMTANFFYIEFLSVWFFNHPARRKFLVYAESIIDQCTTRIIDLNSGTHGSTSTFQGTM